jgi:8-oxo-dGTP diphosphatase
VREELAIEIELGTVLNVYSRGEERVVLIVYTATTTGTPRPTTEASEVNAFQPDELPWHELAFWSTERALRDFLSAP